MTTAEYITKPGDRWDLIAFKAYGTIGNIIIEDGTSMNAMSYLVAANPAIERSSILPEGLLLQVPIIPNTSVVTDSQLLPPWKN